jgi:hypothetical protein
MLAQARFLIDMNNLLDIRDRVIVAAGSTSGLGRAIALGLAEHGAIVVPSGRREEELTRYVEKLMRPDNGHFAVRATFATVHRLMVCEMRFSKNSAASMFWSMPRELHSSSRPSASPRNNGPR